MRKSDEVVVTTRGALWRSRWAAIGAAMAVVAGLGGLGVAFAGGNEAAAVPVTPCRLVDTRPGAANLGGRVGPLGQGQTMTVSVTGRLPQCNIPVSARGIVLNVTAVGGTADSYLTVWPSGRARPTASNVNWRAGQGATANQVTALLSEAGSLSVYNHAGTVDVVVDAAAYLTGTAPDRITASEIGQRRWSQDRGRPANITTSNQPVYAAFDGRSVYVSNGSAGTVQRIDPETNTVVGESTSPTQPRGMAFDGTNLWVADYSTDSVWKYPAAGGNPSQIAVGDGPDAVAFDGTYVWVLNSTANTASRIVASTGAASVTVSFGAGTLPAGLASDGTNMYVSLFNSDTLVKINQFSLAQTPIVVGNGPSDVEFDGKYVWVVNANASTVSRVLAETGAVTTSGVLGASLDGLAFDGNDLWVGLQGSSTLLKVDRTTLTGGNSIGLAGQPSNVMWDGTNLWAPLPGVDKIAKVQPR